MSDIYIRTIRHLGFHRFTHNGLFPYCVLNIDFHEPMFPHLGLHTMYRRWLIIQLFEPPQES